MLDVVRAVALALPEVTERPSHGMPTWFVRGRRSFASVADHHHGDPHVCLWAAAPPGVAAEMAAADPARFVIPPYVGHRGWLALRLDGTGSDAPDAAEIRGVLTEAYRCVAPLAFVALLDAPNP